MNKVAKLFPSVSQGPAARRSNINRAAGLALLKIARPDSYGNETRDSLDVEQGINAAGGPTIQNRSFSPVFKAFGGATGAAGAGIGRGVGALMLRGGKLFGNKWLSDAGQSLGQESHNMYARGMHQMLNPRTSNAYDDRVYGGGSTGQKSTLADGIEVARDPSATKGQRILGGIGTALAGTKKTTDIAGPVVAAMIAGRGAAAIPGAAKGLTALGGVVPAINNIPYLGRLATFAGEGYAANKLGPLFQSGVQDSLLQNPESSRLGEYAQSMEGNKELKPKFDNDVHGEVSRILGSNPDMGSEDAWNQARNTVATRWRAGREQPGYFAQHAPPVDYAMHGEDQALAASRSMGVNGQIAEEPRPVWDKVIKDYRDRLMPQELRGQIQAAGPDKNNWSPELYNRERQWETSARQNIAVYDAKLNNAGVKAEMKLPDEYIKKYIAPEQQESFAAWKAKGGQPEPELINALKDVHRHYNIARQGNWHTLPEAAATAPAVAATPPAAAPPPAPAVNATAAMPDPEMPVPTTPIAAGAPAIKTSFDRWITKMAEGLPVPPIAPAPAAPAPPTPEPPIVPTKPVPPEEPAPVGPPPQAPSTPELATSPQAASATPQQKPIAPAGGAGTTDLSFLFAPPGGDQAAPPGNAPATPGAGATPATAPQTPTAAQPGQANPATSTPGPAGQPPKETPQPEPQAAPQAKPPELIKLKADTEARIKADPNWAQTPEGKAQIDSVQNQHIQSAAAAEAAKQGPNFNKEQYAGEKTAEITTGQLKKDTINTAIQNHAAETGETPDKPGFFQRCMSHISGLVEGIMSGDTGSMAQMAGLVFGFGGVIAGLGSMMSGGAGIGNISTMIAGALGIAGGSGLLNGLFGGGDKTQTTTNSQQPIAGAGSTEVPIGGAAAGTPSGAGAAPPAADGQSRGFPTDQGVTGQQADTLRQFREYQANGLDAGPPPAVGMPGNGPSASPGATSPAPGLGTPPAAVAPPGAAPAAPAPMMPPMPPLGPRPAPVAPGATAGPAPMPGAKPPAAAAPPGAAPMPVAPQPPQQLVQTLFTGTGDPKQVAQAGKQLIEQAHSNPMLLNQILNPSDPKTMTAVQHYMAADPDFAKKIQEVKAGISGGIAKHMSKKFQAKVVMERSGPVTARNAKGVATAWGAPAVGLEEALWLVQMAKQLPG